MFHHKRSLYPFVIALLSLALGGLIYATLNTSVQVPEGKPSSSPVSEDDYRSHARDVVAPFLSSYRTAGTNVAKLVAVEDALSALIPLVVPASFKEVHFRLAVALTLMRDGIRAEDTAAVETGYAKLLEVTNDYPWLAQ